jgi:predicted DNA-binding protein (UPF0278 family)
VLQGFEEYTTPLSDYEKKLIPAFVVSFKKHIGKGQAVTNKEIIEAFGKIDVHLSETQVRKIINHIRNNHLVPGLIASSKGYYITKDVNELNNTSKALTAVKMKYAE